ncbi:MAG: XylB [Spirochaetia bacterium]|nr:XylB [Spirochaetia bacterium]
MSVEALLGIDAGTSSVKVCAYSLDGTLLRRQSSKVSLMSGKPGHAELDVDAYWEQTRTLIRSITAGEQITILGVGFSTTCPTTICLDEQLRAVRPGITYLDNRSQSYVDKYVSQFADEESYVRRVGNRASVSTCSIATAMWIQDHEPQNWKKTASVGMLNSFLAARLTGRAAIDRTQASYSGVFVLQEQKTWDPELLKRAGIEQEKMLPVVEPSHAIGEVSSAAAEETGLRAGTAVAIGSADTAVAAFAIGFKRPNTAFESVGTSGVLSFVLDRPVFDPVFMNRCHIIPDLWLAHGAMSMMGGALDWITKQIWDDCGSPQELDVLAGAGEPGAHGVVFLPYLSGERSPIWDPDAVGLWYGMTLKTTKLDMIEAVYESGAYALKQIKDHARAMTGVEISSITAVGNGTNSRHWNQLKADILSSQYIPTTHGDASSFGAALLGGVAAGIYRDVRDDTIPQMALQETTYSPRAGVSKDSYERAYRIYRALYPALKDIMHGSAK